MTEKIPVSFIAQIFASLVTNNSDVAGAKVSDALNQILGTLEDYVGISYTNSSNPLITTNPSTTGVVWVNSTTGEIFVCIDNTTDHNTWNGSFGSIVSPPFSSFMFVSGNLGAGTSKTVSVVPIGTPNNNRIVVATIHYAIGGTASVNSVTIGGITATLAVQATGSNTGVAIYYAVVPTGSIANINVTWNTSIARAYVGVQCIYNAVSTTPAGTNASTGGVTSSRSINLTAPDDGIVLAASTSDGNDCSPTNLDSNNYLIINATDGDSGCTGAKKTPIGGAFSSSATCRIMVGAVWE